MKIIFTIVCVCGLLVPVWGEETSALGVAPGILSPTEEANTLIAQGDAFFGIRTEDRGAEEAMAAYENALKKADAQVEAFWKAARAAHWVADNSKEKKTKVIWFEKGIAYAKKAIALEPRSVEAHFWLGANYGSYGESRGVLKSLALVKPIRNEMETVIRLDDKYQGGAGYRVLGVVDYKVPPFAGGSKKRALENLNKAMGIDSTNAFNLYYLAEYFEAMGDRYKALAQLSLLEKCTPTLDVDAPDLKSIQEKGKKLKKKLD